MFRATYHSSSGALNFICSLWFIYPCGEQPLSRLSGNQTFNRIYYSEVYWRLNMFRATHRSSSGALNFIYSDWFIYPCGERPLSRLSGNQTFNRIYYSKVYWRLNMFRATYRSSSGALNFICSLWFIYPFGERPLSRLSGNQTCNSICYYKVHWRLNMFRATHCSSSGVLNCICSLWFIYPCGDRLFSRLSGNQPCNRIYYSKVF
jgi:hypothetical protein